MVKEKDRLAYFSKIEDAYYLRVDVRTPGGVFQGLDSNPWKRGDAGRFARLCQREGVIPQKRLKILQFMQ